MSRPPSKRISESEAKRRLLNATGLPGDWWCSPDGSIREPYSSLSLVHLAEKLAYVTGQSLHGISLLPSIDSKSHRRCTWITGNLARGISEEMAEVYERVGRHLEPDLRKLCQGRAITPELAVDPNRLFLSYARPELLVDESGAPEVLVDQVLEAFSHRSLAAASFPPVTHWATRNRAARRTPDGMRALATAVNRLSIDNPGDSCEGLTTISAPPFAERARPEPRSSERTER